MKHLPAVFARSCPRLMVNRRESIVAFAALGAAPIGADAQPSGKVARIGYLSTNLADCPHTARGLPSRTA